MLLLAGNGLVLAAAGCDALTAVLEPAKITAKIFRYNSSPSVTLIMLY